MKIFAFLLLLQFSILAFCEDWKFQFKNGDSIRSSSFSLTEDAFLFFSGSAFESKDFKRPFKDLDYCFKDGFKSESGEYLIRLSDLSSIRCRINNIKDGVVNAHSDAIGSLAIPLVNISEFTVLNVPGSKESSEQYVNWRDLSNWKLFPEKFAQNFVFVEDKILIKGTLLACIRSPYDKLKISFSSFADFDNGLAVMFFANIAKENTEAYKFHIYPHSVNLIRKKADDHKDLGSHQFNNPTHLFPIFKIDIFANRDKGVFFIIINDEKIFQFVDKEPGKILGDYIVFACPFRFVIISDLDISEWDGSVPKVDKNSVADNLLSKNEDMILLRNNDSMRGELVLISGKDVKFKTSFGSLDIPSERISKIVMKGPATKNTDKTDIKETLQDSFFNILFGKSSFLNAEITRIDSKSIFLKHKILGELSIAKDFVREIKTMHNDSIPTKRNSLFDEIFHSTATLRSIDDLGDNEMKEMEEELGHLLELCY